MSFYATMQGEVTYPNPQDFETMLKELRHRHYMDDGGYFLDEMGHRLTEHPNIILNLLTIEIPMDHWRNLPRWNFFTEGATGWIIGTSTDGCFCGWVIENGEERNYDLEEWAKDNNIPPLLTPEDDENYFQDLCDWQMKVEEDFWSSECP